MSQHDLLDTLRSLALPDDCPSFMGRICRSASTRFGATKNGSSLWGAGELRSDSGNLSLMPTGIPYQGHGPRS